MLERAQVILLIDRDPGDRTRLSKILANRFEVEVATSGTEGLAKLSQTAYDLILIDWDTLGLQIDIFVKHLKEKALTTKMALITSRHLEDYIAYIKEWQIVNVLPKQENYNPAHLLLVVENFINPENAFGLRRYLSTMIRKNNIVTRDDKSYMVSKIINFFGGSGFSSARLYDVRLVLEEMINNAIYHAFCDENGQEKYRASNFEHLEDDEQLRLDYGFLDDMAGFCVTDNRGHLQPAKIIETLCRQYDKGGLYDQSGRGLFLSRRFSDTLIINIRRNRSTQIIALFNRLISDDKEENKIKPFYINYVE